MRLVQCPNTGTGHWALSKAVGSWLGLWRSQPRGPGGSLLPGEAGRQTGLHQAREPTCPPPESLCQDNFAGASLGFKGAWHRFMRWRQKHTLPLSELAQPILFQRELKIMPGAAQIKVSNRHCAVRLAFVNESLSLFPTSRWNHFYVGRWKEKAARLKPPERTRCVNVESGVQGPVLYIPSFCLKCTLLSCCFSKMDVVETLFLTRWCQITWWFWFHPNVVGS